MKILMTGATGYIGRFLSKRIAGEGHELYCIVRPASDVHYIKEWAHRIVPVSENAALYEAVDEIGPDLVIHVASMFLGEHSRENIEPLFESNVVFPSVLLDAADRSGCKYLINTGSYWQNFDGETYNPMNLYAATKQAFEDVIRFYTECRGLRAVTLQLFDVFGPEDPRRKVLNIVRGLKDGDSLDMSPGEQKLYMCYIDDVVDAYMHTVKMITALEAGACRKYAVRGERPDSLREILDTYLRVSGKQVTLRWGAVPYKRIEFMDPGGTGAVLEGWSPKYSLEEAMEAYCSG